MRIYNEKNLYMFDFWGGAEHTAQFLTEEEFETLEAILEDVYGEIGISEYEVNDLFRHEEDAIAQWLGYESFSEMIKDRE